MPRRPRGRPKATDPHDGWCSCRNGLHAQKIKQRYGITLEQYDELLRKQGGVCAICGNEEIAQSNSGRGDRRRLSVDHCHRGGGVRGLLCQRCNAGLGYFRDNPKFLRRAAAYLSLYAIDEGVEVTK